MKLVSPKNSNYCATVVEIDNLYDLPGCDNLRGTKIFGNQIIVDKDTPIGSRGVFFPLECQLSHKFIAANNLYRKPELGNVDPQKKGFFEESRRVKALKLRGHKSEGFFIPDTSLESFVPWSLMLETLKVGDSFDELEGQEICRKYVPKHNPPATSVARARVVRLEDKILMGQFRFHVETDNLRKNAHKVLPRHYIAITEKLHGCQGTVANILVRRSLKWYEKLARRLGVKVAETEYGITWSSRRAVKGIAGESKTGASHYYDSDVWGDVASYVGPLLPKGYTVYGEITGYTKEGSPIQKGYDYGCEPGHHCFWIYRVTVTNEDGVVEELTWPQVLEFCGSRAWVSVPPLYYGRADQFEPFLEKDTLIIWQQELLVHLERDFVHDQMCPLCNNDVPAEGIVLRIDDPGQTEFLKLKNFKFLEWETKQLDAGVVDMETAEGESNEVSI